MKRKHFRSKRKKPRTVLRLPDLEIARTAVLQGLTSPDSQRGYRHAMDEFVDWYCSEPRLAFNKTVVIRYRNHLESRSLAPGTINLRLGAVRRLAHEAADCGLLTKSSRAYLAVLEFHDEDLSRFSGIRRSRFDHFSANDLRVGRWTH